jgi:hypothetical protein
MIATSTKRLRKCSTQGIKEAIGCLVDGDTREDGPG